MADESDKQPAPRRILLNHAPPSWVRSGDIFFITLCTQPRGLDRLCNDGVAEVIFETVAHRQATHIWYCRLMLLMPDHLHALVACPSNQNLKQVITSFKRYTGRGLDLKWQRDFFDHRLRGDEGLQQKAAYIRQNPVRAQLVDKAEDWPFVWEPGEPEA